MQSQWSEKQEKPLKQHGRQVCYRNGRLYFTRQLERRIFFALTIGMLVWGVLEKLEIF